MPLDLDVAGATIVEITAADAEIARLAALPALACERELAAAAEKLKCRTPILDRLVAAERGEKKPAGQGRKLELFEPEPWPDPVDGAALLDELAAAIRRYVVLSAREADAAALWALGTHAFNAWHAFPRLLATAPERGCGKTTLLDVLSRAIPRPLAASNITAAALFRTIEAARPSLLLDEADTFAKDSEDLRGMLDAGHLRGGAVIRTVGDDHEPRQFSCWAPVALAAIGRLPGTIEDRSIIIRMRRRRPDEAVESLRLDRIGVLDQLARGAARWAIDHLDELREADPEMPASLYNRAADNWRPFLAIADLADGEWPERARAAAVELTGSEPDEGSARVLLLGDLRELFDAESSSVLFSDEILKALAERDDRPWPEFRAGKTITGRQLAGLLKPFGVTTKNTVRRGDRTAKGYRREAFEDAFARYLPPSVGVTGSQPAETLASSQNLGVTNGSHDPCCDPNVTPTKTPKPSNSRTCDPVTPQSPQNYGNGASPPPEGGVGSAEEADEWTA